MQKQEGQNVLSHLSKEKANSQVLLYVILPSVDLKKILQQQGRFTLVSLLTLTDLEQCNLSFQNLQSPAFRAALIFMNIFKLNVYILYALLESKLINLSKIIFHDAINSWANFFLNKHYYLMRQHSISTVVLGHWLKLTRQISLEEDTCQNSTVSEPYGTTRITSNKDNN